jgi:hypothetical protein
MTINDLTRPYRAWINQPSSTQPHHAMHGRVCIAINDPKVPGTADIYFTDGGVISMRVDTMVLSVAAGQGVLS